MNPNYSSPRHFGNLPNSPTYTPPSALQPKPFPFPKSPGAPLSGVNPSKSYIHAKSPNFDPKHAPMNTKHHDNSFQHTHNHNAKPETLKSTIDSNHGTKDSPHFPKSEGRIGPPQGRKQPRFSEPAMNPDLPFDPAQDPKKSFVPFRHEPKEQPELHFTKKPPAVDTKEEVGRREWLKSSGRRKPLLTLDNFDIIKALGKGKYGQVHLARDKRTGFMVAIKVVEKAMIIEEGIVEQFSRQVKIQMFFNHANIVKMYGCFHDEKNIYILLELATTGPLVQQLQRADPMPEVKAAGLMKQVCEAVKELHSCRVIHRDIKPQNIVMHEGVAKLCDFGWSVYRDDKMRTTFCGTPLYVSPQILKGNHYDEKIDIWSLGIMAYEILVGENPFKIKKEEELIKIVKEEISIPSYVFVSREAREFLDKSLRKDPEERVGIKELCTHPFFSKNEEKEKQEKKVHL